MLRAVSVVLRAFGSLSGFIVVGTFGFVLMQSNVRVSLSEALKSADVLVTAVLGVGGWLFITFLDNVNVRFNSVDQRFDSVNERLTGVEKTLQELKSLILQSGSGR